MSREQIINDLRMLLQTQRVLWTCSWGPRYESHRLQRMIDKKHQELKNFDKQQGMKNATESQGRQ